MGKYIIAVCAPEETGKTTLVNNVWDMLPAFNSDEKIILNNRKPYEIIGIVNPPSSGMHPVVRDKKIGVNSLGDKPYQISEGLAVLAHHECDIIVCTARSENDLEEAIDNIATTEFSCNLDKIFEGTPLSLKNADIEAIAAKVKEYEVIVCCQFYAMNITRMPLKQRYKQPAPDSNPMIEIGNVNLSRVSAQNIIDLIDRLD